MPAKNIPLIGVQFNSWTVVGAGSKSKYWLCKCVCGVVKDVDQTHLKNGASKCCGCLYKGPIQHGGAANGKETKLYRIWKNIKQRCLNPSNEKFHVYGGAGKTICDEWKHNFEAFKLHMGEPPSPLHSVDRIENDKGYFPGNVKWSTPKEQSRNQSTNNLVTIDGVTKCVTEWCEATGIDSNLAYARIHRLAWEPARAVTTPSRGRKPNGYYD